MSPVWMFEGRRALDPVSQRNLVERRFAALSTAVREHEAQVRRQHPAMRPCDAALYRRLREIVSAEPAVVEAPDAWSRVPSAEGRPR